MHDLVDDLAQRLVVVNLAVMHFLWLAPAAIKQNLGRCNACHRWAIRFHHDTGQRFDGRVGVCSCKRRDVSAVFWHFPLVMFCKHSLQSASALTNQSSRSRAALKVGCGSVAPHWIIVHFIERGACHIAPRDLAALVPRGRHRLLDMPSRPLRPCPNKILTTPRSGTEVPISVCPRPAPWRRVEKALFADDVNVSNSFRER